MTEQTKNRIRKMVADRDWNQYHTPANLAILADVMVLLSGYAGCSWP